jgi:hypothetical protein
VGVEDDIQSSGVAQQGQKEHDETVLAVAQTANNARPGATIYADHVSGFGEKQELPPSASPVAAAFVPTQALFSKFVVLNAADLDWKIPDVVVRDDGFRYLVEVGSYNESFVRAARKLESMIYAAKAWNVCGIALVSAPSPGGKAGYSGATKELARLRETFRKVFRVPNEIDLADTLVPYLQTLLAEEPLRQEVGGIPDWASVVELDAGDWAWTNDLVIAMTRAFSGGKCLVR